MERAADLANTNLVYLNTSVKKNLGVSPKNIVTQTKPADCTLTCSLMKPGCEEPVDDTSTHLVINDSGSLLADQNVVSGYTETVCIKCTNSIDILKQTTFTVTQEKRTDPDRYTLLQQGNLSLQIQSV